NPSSSPAKEMLSTGHFGAKFTTANAVSVYGVGVCSSGAPFMAMEFLDGHSLRKELHQTGPMEPSRALGLFRSALEALAEAHNLGIVHKDLKPANLFLTELDTPQERLRIVDFGLAYSEQAQRLTMQDEISGTLEYMAPEYLEHQGVSRAVDVYQMGLILVEMLSGTPVIQNGKPVMRIAAHMDGDLPIPDRLLGSPLGPVIMDALALNPNDRFPDAGAFLASLNQLKLPNLERLDPKGEPTTLLSSIDREHSGPGSYTNLAVAEQRNDAQMRTTALVAIAVAVLAFIGLAIAGLILALR
ncbi:MAG: serine/threonine-protein kinase, partial [Myxococcota bacterium]